MITAYKGMISLSKEIWGVKKIAFLFLIIMKAVTLSAVNQQKKNGNSMGCKVENMHTTTCSYMEYVILVFTLLESFVIIMAVPESSN